MLFTCYPDTTFYLKFLFFFPWSFHKEIKIYYSWYESLRSWFLRKDEENMNKIINTDFKTSLKWKVTGTKNYFCLTTIYSFMQCLLNSSIKSDLILILKCNKLITFCLFSPELWCSILLVINSASIYFQGCFNFFDKPS